MQVFSIIKNLDIYGKSIQFSYKNSNLFSTTLGVIVSLLVYFIILAYFLLLLSETLMRNQPHIIENLDIKRIAPNYRFYMDYPSLFNSTEIPVKVKAEELTNSTSGQISIGFIDTNTERNVPIDPQVFTMNIVFTDKAANITRDLYFDICRRFFTFNQEMTSGPTYRSLATNVCVHFGFITCLNWNFCQITLCVLTQTHV